ncbi:MAG: CPBP family intramembrane metalloprotease [Clostridia bacterium]|nr:CPBP family intramembrane metalloprotease [Clostridia bacterium]
MSRSKREAQVQTDSAPRKGVWLWSTGHGSIRTGWLLAASLFSYALVALATRYGLIRAFAALFDVWRIDPSNVRRAPAWARAVYVWHGSLATLACAALTLLLAGRLRKLWGLEGALTGAPSAGLWRGSSTGVLAAIVVVVLCLLPDSLRPEWPLTAPRLGWTLPVMAVISLFSTLAEEAFTKRVLFDGLRRRWGRLWAAALVSAVFWLTGGGPAAGVVGSVNALLLGWVVCALYAGYGLWTAVGFRWGWSVATVFLLGFGGGEASVYRFYGVSEALLTGGDAGIMHGLWTTLLLAGMIIAVSLKHK